MTPLEETSSAVRTAQVESRGGPFLRLRLLWAAVTEPRHMSLVYGGVYTVVMLTGIATLSVPPQTIAGELGPVLAVAWALLFLLGGTLGMVTVLPGWWHWERWAITLTLSGIAIYGFVILSLHFTASGSRLTQLGILLLAASVFIVRWTFIRGRSFGPRVR